jgi:hypothetical protein
MSINGLYGLKGSHTPPLALLTGLDSVIVFAIVEN